MTESPGRLRRLRPWTAVGLLAATCYLPLLLTHRGQVGADTKTYLYLDPDRLLGRAWSMWDPNVGLGTVPHQNIGYLWPMGPFYWTFEHLGVPDWIAQRLWLGSILFLAGLGVRYLMRTLGRQGPGVAAAMFLYALSPYVLTLGARISALLLPFTALGWLLGLTIRATRERTWVHPAWFALLVPTCGSSNATALLLVGLAPALWIPYATFVLKEIRFRAAVGVVVRIGVLTVGASLWWIVGLWCQGAFGIDVLRYTETARTVANASAAPELLRGIGYWYFYGDDKLGPWIEPSSAYTQNPALITLTYGIPILGLLAAALVRWQHRAYFVALIVGGLVIAVGAHPWGEGAPIAAGFEVFLRSQVGLAMRSLPRAVPLISLSLAVLVGVAVEALAPRLPRVERAAAVGIALLAVVGLPPLWLGQMVADNLQRDEELPAYWTAAAAEIDARGRGEAGYTSRVLEVPGSDFASYRWGNTVDPITPGITDRPYVARELIPYGTAASADLLNALDRQIQEGLLDPDAIAPLARLMGVGDIVQRSDLAYERFNLARPRQVYELLREAEGVGDVTGFGGDAPQVPDPRLPLEDEVELGADPDLPDPPQVGLFAVEGDPTIVSAKPEGSTVLLAGNGDGLVAAAAAGLIDGTELLRYAATAEAVGGGGAEELRAAVEAGGALVVTDTNRRAGRRWGTVRETDGATETVDQGPSADDPSDNRLPLFEGAGTDSETVSVWSGGVEVDATSYGNAITYTPEDRAAGALDDDPDTAWYTGAFADPRGERIDLTYDEPRTTDRIRLVQAARGVQNRWITEVLLRFDDGSSQRVALGAESRQVQGQWIDLGGERTFSALSVEITGTDIGTRDSYADLSAVGFADIRLGDDDVRLEESFRPPTDLLDALGEDSDDLPLAIALTRLRARSTAALRADPETALVRDLDLPTARSFSVTGDVRLADLAPDDVLDGLLGLPAVDEGGVAVDASRHLPGDLTARATAAIDGDPTTSWMPGFLGQDAEWASYTQAEPVTFDHMDLQIVADGRHTVPTRLRIVADGRTATIVDLPEIEDRAEDDATVAVPVDLPEPVTGRRIEIHVEASREVTTLDWISNSPVVMPVGIAEWGIEGIAADIPTGRFDTGCRDDLLTVAGEAVPVRVTGTVEDALAGDALDLALCDGALDLPAGGSQLRTARGRDTGLHVDTLTLRSAAGGAADTGTGTVLDGTDRPDPVTAEVTRSDRWRRTVTVGPRAEPTWLVVGESHNLGWQASIDGEDLGEPVLVDGYSTAFLLPPGDEPVVVEVAWAPQRVVLAGLAASVVAALLALLLALRPLLARSASLRSASVRWRRGAAAAVVPAPRDAPPVPLDLAAALRSPGTAPGWPASLALALGTGVLGWAAVNLVAGVALAVAALVTVRFERARPVLALGPAALLAVSGAFIVFQQVRHRLPEGFEWPQRFGRVHGVAYAGVLLLALGVVVDRLRTGSWTAGDEAEPDP
ncbi:MAG TPA: alpha-(1-_3)-arabinofuranosyltransferase family protein [Iamia sp.]|nr:alpha-(1->3)-arabinofuranosyltransferase family protein [Iamia sp.]